MKVPILLVRNLIPIEGLCSDPMGRQKRLVKLVAAALLMRLIVLVDALA